MDTQNEENYTKNEQHNKNTILKSTNTTEDPNNYSEIDINNTNLEISETDISKNISTDNEASNIEFIPNVILIGSKKSTPETEQSPIENDITELSRSKSENEDCINPENGLIIPKTEIETEETCVTVTKRKKKPRQSELELLGKQEVIDDDYVAYSDDVNVYRKYKLRKILDAPIIQEPIVDIKIKSKLKEELSCHKCFQSFDNRYSLTSHMKQHQDTFLCLLCSQRFNNNEQLISHKNTHEKQSFLCSECKLAFSEHKDYLVHYYSHIKEPDVQCLECEQIFKKRNITAHILSHFSKQLKCPTCFISFNSEASYENHRSRHGYVKSNEKITCIECGETVKVSKDEFERHMYRHTGVKKYQCLFCGKCFATDISRNFHTRLHSEFQPASQYTCEKCNKSFTQINDYKKHMLRHGEKTVECDVCQRKFYDKYSLKLHMRLHNEERLYKCTECEFCSSTSTGLRSHMISKHTPGDHVMCEICNCEFSQPKYYLKHCRSKKHKRNLYGLGNNSENYLESSE